MNRVDGLLSNLDITRPLTDMKPIDHYDTAQLRQLGKNPAEYVVIENLVQQFQPQGLAKGAEGEDFVLLGALVPVPTSAIDFAGSSLLGAEGEMPIELHDAIPLAPVIRMVVHRDRLGVEAKQALETVEESGVEHMDGSGLQ